MYIPPPLAPPHILGLPPHVPSTGEILPLHPPFVLTTLLS